MKQLYIDIKTKVKTELPEIKHVAVWNNQVALISDSLNQGFDDSYCCPPLPCLFIEIISPAEIKQLGNGNQHYDPLDIDFHIVHDFYNGDNMEENLEIFDLKQAVYAKFSQWIINGSGVFIRSNEVQDTEHSNVYHFIQRYRTSYIDSSLNKPVNPIILNPPIAVNITRGLEIDNNTIRTGNF